MLNPKTFAAECEIARLTAKLPGASRAVARQLQQRLNELRDQIEAAKRQEKPA
jgi:hypothetical protein